MAKDQQPNYQEAFEEIQNILEEIESGEVTIDELSEKVKRAALLMEICRNKLKSTGETVQQILDKMEKEDQTNADSEE